MREINFKGWDIDVEELEKDMRRYHGKSGCEICLIDGHIKKLYKKYGVITVLLWLYHNIGFDYKFHNLLVEMIQSQVAEEVASQNDSVLDKALSKAGIYIASPTMYNIKVWEKALFPDTKMPEDADAIGKLDDQSRVYQQGLYGIKEVWSTVKPINNKEME